MVDKRKEERLMEKNEAMKILKDYISWKLKSDDMKPFQISAEIKET